MIKKIGVENFRIFKEKTHFDLAPITVLIGPNNSGKSSLLRLLKLLNVSSNQSILNFDSKDNNTGTFKQALHWAGNKDYLKLVFDMPELSFDEKFQIELTYVKENENGMINSFRVFNTHRDLVYIHDIKFNEISDQYEKSDSTLKYIDIDFLFTIDLTYIKQCFHRKARLNESESFPLYLSQEYAEMVYKESIKTVPQENIFNVITRLGVGKFKKEHDFVTNGEWRMFEFVHGYTTENKRLLVFEDIEKNIAYDKEYLSPKLGSFQFNTSTKNTDLIKELLSNKDKGLEKSLFFDILNRKIIPPEVKGIVSEKNFTHYGRLAFDYFLRNINYGLNQLNAFQSNLNFLSHNRGTKKRILENKDYSDINQIVKAFNEIDLNDIDYTFLQNALHLLEIEGQVVIKRMEGVISIFYIEQNGKLINLADLGFGYSQVIPVLLKVILIDKNYYFDDKKENERKVTNYPTLVIEEIEANLHPNLQSKLADVLHLAHTTYGTKFIIESHSEYMIRKLQYLVAKKELKTDDVVLYYFNDDRNVTDKEKKVKKIEIDEFGGLTDTFGPGFYDEATRLQFELLRLNQEQSN